MSDVSVEAGKTLMPLEEVMVILSGSLTVSADRYNRMREAALHYLKTGDIVVDKQWGLVQKQNPNHRRNDSGLGES